MNRIIKSNLNLKPMFVMSKDYSCIKPWGIYTSIDCYNCNKSLITSENHIRNYVTKLCNIMKIKPFSDCKIIKLGLNKTEGYSMAQLSKKSNISGHFISENDKIFIDVFSSQEYDSYEVISFTREYFEAKTYIYDVKNRY